VAWLGNHNPLVGGSNPPAATIEINGLDGPATLLKARYRILGLNGASPKAGHHLLSRHVRNTSPLRNLAGGNHERVLLRFLISPPSCGRGDEMAPEEALDRHTIIACITAIWQLLPGRPPAHASGDQRGQRSPAAIAACSASADDGQLCGPGMPL
jgi:hypothetical protein